MPLTYLTLYDSAGRFHSDISDAIDKGVTDLVTNVVETITSPAPIDRISQILLINEITSRLESRLIQDVAFRNSRVGRGGQSEPTYDPLTILEDDIGKAFESAEDGRFGDGMSAHDVLQSVERMISYAKKGTHYFSDDEE